MPFLGFWLSNTMSRLDLLAGSDTLSFATGFFLKHDRKWHLVTNWHVLAGRHPKTRQPLHASGAIPETCRYYGAKLLQTGVAWRQFEAKLWEPGKEHPCWREHPTLGSTADVAVMEIPGESIPLAKDLLDPSGHDSSMVVDIGTDVFLPGYPRGLTAGGGLPLWKRASVASSLEIQPGSDRCFFVDTATRDGMSGAPCLALSDWRHYSLDRATNQVKVVERPFSSRFLGIYSGRLNPSDSFEAQIGVVWRESLVLDTLAAGKTPTLPGF